MLFVFHLKILHKHCLQFLMALRETENNAYAKFCGDKQRILVIVDTTAAPALYIVGQ